MLNKSKIEWCDYSINLVKGLCPMACPYCYARRMYKRFKWNPEIRFDTDTLKLTGLNIKEGSKIFVGSTIELFGEWVKPEWLKRIFTWVTAYPEYTFIFLTKQPQNLAKWSPFPDNCWVGVSATNAHSTFTGENALAHIKSKVKFISFEPLLNRVENPAGLLATTMRHIDWVIIGAQTPYSKKTAPKMSWVQEILVACYNTNIPVFMKNNLQPVMDDTTEWAGWKLRQEFPVIHAEAKG